jgi:hypothetical protein
MTVLRGILQGFDAGAYKATVQVAGATGSWLTGVSVSRDIAAGDMIVGRYVAIYAFEVSNPTDAVLFAVWT